jgi:cytochrome c553
MGCAGKAGLLLVALLAGAAPASTADLAEKMAPCLACHGEKGQSELDNVPSLGGQTSAYALIQIYMFREKIRIGEPMNEATKGLSDDDLRAISDAVEKLPAPKPPADKGDPARLEKARALAEEHRCNICHRPDFSGQQSVPRLADQREDYLLKTLKEYKSGERRAYEPSMVEAVQQVPEKQLAELAYYLSHLR